MSAVLMAQIGKLKKDIKRNSEKGGINKSFIENEQVTIPLGVPVETPALSVTKEVPQMGVTKNTWDSTFFMDKGFMPEHPCTITELGSLLVRIDTDFSFSKNEIGSYVVTPGGYGVITTTSGEVRPLSGSLVGTHTEGMWNITDIAPGKTGHEVESIFLTSIFSEFQAVAFCGTFYLGLKTTAATGSYKLIGTKIGLDLETVLQDEWVIHEYTNVYIGNLDTFRFEDSGKVLIGFSGGTSHSQYTGIFYDPVSDTFTAPTRLLTSFSSAEFKTSINGETIAFCYDYTRLTVIDSSGTELTNFTSSRADYIVLSKNHLHLTSRNVSAWPDYYLLSYDIRTGVRTSVYEEYDDVADEDSYVEFLFIYEDDEENPLVGVISTRNDTYERFYLDIRNHRSIKYGRRRFNIPTGLTDFQYLSIKRADSDNFVAIKNNYLMVLNIKEGKCYEVGNDANNVESYIKGKIINDGMVFHGGSLHTVTGLYKNTRPKVLVNTDRGVLNTKFWNEVDSLSLETTLGNGYKYYYAYSVDQGNSYYAVQEGSERLIAKKVNDSFVYNVGVGAAITYSPKKPELLSSYVAENLSRYKGFLGLYGNRIFLSGRNDGIHVFDFDPATNAITFSEKNKTIPDSYMNRACCFSADGMYFFGVSDNQVHIYQLTSPYSLSTGTLLGYIYSTTTDVYYHSHAWVNDSGDKIVIYQSNSDLMKTINLQSPYTPTITSEAEEPLGIDVVFADRDRLVVDEGEEDLYSVYETASTGHPGSFLGTIRKPDGRFQVTEDGKTVTSYLMGNPYKGNESYKAEISIHDVTGYVLDSTEDLEGNEGTIEKALEKGFVFIDENGVLDKNPGIKSLGETLKIATYTSEKDKIPSDSLSRISITINGNVKNAGAVNGEDYIWYSQTGKEVVFTALKDLNMNVRVL